MGGAPLNLDVRWAELERPLHVDTGHLRSRLPIGAPVDVYIAVAEPSGCRALILAFDHEVDLESLRAIRLRGLDVAAAPFLLEGTRSSVSLTTRSVAYNGLFARLVEDLLLAIESETSETGVVDAVGRRLQNWQRFLELVDPEGLSMEAQAGLFGELWFLRDNLLPVLGPTAVAAWQGPLRAMQDFQAGDWAIEVKTSRQAAPASVRVANERQLQGDGLATLALAVVALEQRVNGSPTLVDMVASLRVALATDPANLTEFEERLMSAGYHDEHQEVYRSNSWAIRWSLCSLITDDFPRLTEHDLPVGVGDVSYSVSIDSCRAHEIGFQQLLERIMRGAP